MNKVLQFIEGEHECDSLFLSAVNDFYFYSASNHCVRTTYDLYIENISSTMMESTSLIESEWDSYVE